MKIAASFSIVATGLALLLSTSAQAAITVHQQAAPAPTYSTTLNFDEPGSPTGAVSTNHWLASLGIHIGDGQGGATFNVVNNPQPFVPTNTAQGDFGLYLDFTTPVSSLSFQAWDSNGPPGPFGGGFFVAVTTQANGGGSVLGSGAFTGAWGGTGNTWYNLTTTAGSTISHVAIYSNGFNQFNYIDNLSWNTVPAPGAMTLLAIGGFIARGRRRRLA